MRCKNCGADNDDNRYICEVCGSPLYDESDFDNANGIDDDRTQTFKAVNEPNNQVQNRNDNYNDYDKETNWGREFGLKLAEEFGLVQLEINEDLESKDFSDLVKNWGKAIAKEYLEKNIKEVPF